MKIKIIIWVFILFDLLNHKIFSQSIGNQTGNQFSFGISRDGTVYTWGYNGYGQLGDNTTTNRSSPVLVLKGAYSGTTYLGDDTDNKIIMMAIWANSAVALDENGLVYSWGRNQYGQLGDNTTTTRTVPVKVLKGAYSGTTYLGDDSSNKIIAVSIGETHGIALAADGIVYAWGLNTYGMLGNNNTTASYIPVKVLKGEYSGSTYLGDDSSNKITSISAGAYFSHTLAADGTVFAFGFNNNGQCGNGTVVSSSPYGQLTPVKVIKGVYSGTTYLGDDSSNKITAINAGAAFGLALDNNGVVYSWGYNNYNQLGDNTTTRRTSPVKVVKGAYSGTTYLGDDSSNKITAISGGNNWGGALGNDGMLYLWGRNNVGQLADGTTTNRGAPVKALKGEYSGTTYIGDNGSNKIIGFAVSSVNAYALAADYTIFSWGHGSVGSLGNNTNNSSYTPVQVSGAGGSGDLTLPVELVSFDVKTDLQAGLTLEWITESELNNLGFILDRRTSMTDWDQIASYITHPELEGQGSVSAQTVYAFTDNTAQDEETYDYRLADVDFDGNKEYHSLQLMGVSKSSTLPEKFVLHQNYPNPFNPTTIIQYELNNDAFVVITIHDILGNVIKVLVSENQRSGHKKIQWNSKSDQGDSVSAGVYFCKIEVENFVATKKILLLK